MPKLYFIGVDVGTSSARAALVSSQGHVVRMHTKDIKIWNHLSDHYEQSSDDIWEAVCECVKNVVRDISPLNVAGISFDATCSLVVIGKDGEPLSVSTNGSDEQNVILWMDHRAQTEAEFINATKHEMLKFVGGKVSLEMQMPKLLWLKNNLNISCWSNIWRVFDLPDFLTWKSTGCDSRSLCSVVCKWNYDAFNNCWSKDFLDKIDLNDLCKNDFEIIGKTILLPGTPVGSGLTESAAIDLGLVPNTCVGTSLIDAHAGALGLFGCNSHNINDDMTSKLALICGTSTCHMSVTREPCSANGVWGPYKSAIIPGLYLNEGGQSCTGRLLDFIVQTHPYYVSLQLQHGTDQNIYGYLNKLLTIMADEKLININFLAKDLHVWPDFHGNRSPIADPSLRGMYGTRHIIDNLQSFGRQKFESLLLCGGLIKNPLYVQMHADVCNLPIIIPNEQEMVLVGAAILGAYAAKVYPSLDVASQAMGGAGKVIKPNPHSVDFHQKKYKVFLKMLADQISYREIMT